MRTGGRFHRGQAGQAGQSMVWVACLILLIGGACVLLSSLGAAARTAARADAVADLTALAGALGGEGGASEVATANGAELVRCGAGETVDVVIALGGRRGTASARAVAGDDTEGS